MNDLWSGLIGALLGSLASFGGALLGFRAIREQTADLLADERQARADERAEEERAHQHEVLAAVLPALADLHLYAHSLHGLAARNRYIGRMGPMGTASRADDGAATETVAAAHHVLYTLVPMITEAEIRRRYRALMEIVEAHVDARFPDQYRLRAQGDLIRYIGHVRHTIKAALLDQPLPEGNPPPVLDREGDESLWAPVEVDSEDIYFVPEQREGKDA